MAAVTERNNYPAAARVEFERLAGECALCYQCGTCTSSCPSGRDLDRGPRRLVRLILAGDMDAVLSSDDLWRCTGCGACSEACRMEIDVAGVLRGLRGLEREHGMSSRCPERAAADLASVQLSRAPRIDMLQFGLGMVAKGHLPKDKMGAAGVGLRLARQMLPGSVKTPSWSDGSTPADATTLPFYAGCALTQDHRLSALVSDVAAGFGVRLQEAQAAGCCGHPSRGAVGSQFDADETVYTVCPACDASLGRSRIQTAPLWDALTARARRQGRQVQAAAARFVPYVGCLADRDAGLAGLSDAAELAGVHTVLSYPSLHSGCCGALGGMYRGASSASKLLLEFADEQTAPVVTPCSLCADNLRSAARELKREVTVHFWPEFFRTAPNASEDQTDG